MMIKESIGINVAEKNRDEQGLVGFFNTNTDMVYLYEVILSGS